MDILSITEAADYLKISRSTVKYHLYVARDLVADGTFGKALYFTTATLDKFQAAKRPPGRPRRKPQEPEYPD